MLKSRYFEDSPAYPFTTENLKELFPRVPKFNSAILTVAGSGDHIFEAILHGASAVYAFDLSTKSLAWAELKRAAILKLTLSEFINFTNPGASALEYNCYLTLRELISESTAKIFDACFEEFERCGAKLRSSSHFNTKHEMELSKPRVSYLCEVRYRELKSLLNSIPIQLIQADVKELSFKFKTHAPFQAILLSNICDYANEIFKIKNGYVERFFAEIVTPLQGLLTTDGFITAAYLYAQDTVQISCPARSEIDDPKLRLELLTKFALRSDEVTIPGVNVNTQDVVVIVKGFQDEKRRAA